MYLVLWRITSLPTWNLLKILNWRCDPRLYIFTCIFDFLLNIVNACSRRHTNIRIIASMSFNSWFLFSWIFKSRLTNDHSCFHCRGSNILMTLFNEWTTSLNSIDCTPHIWCWLPSCWGWFVSAIVSFVSWIFLQWLGFHLFSVKIRDIWINLIVFHISSLCLTGLWSAHCDSDFLSSFTRRLRNVVFFFFFSFLWPKL